MDASGESYILISPEVEEFLTNAAVDVGELIRQIDVTLEVRRVPDPSSVHNRTKDPATILLASSAVLAAATPVLRELIRSLSGREAIVSERRLVPVEDAKGRIVRDAHGEPLLHWIDISRADPNVQSVKIKGFGVEISFGGR